MAGQVSWLGTERDIVEKMGYKEACRAWQQCPSDKRPLLEVGGLVLAAIY